MDFLQIVAVAPLLRARGNAAASYSALARRPQRRAPRREMAAEDQPLGFERKQMLLQGRRRHLHALGEVRDFNRPRRRHGAPDNLALGVVNFGCRRARDREGRRRRGGGAFENRLGICRGKYRGVLARNQHFRRAR